MELYSSDKVFFIAPLSKQFDFYADEAIPEYEPSSSEEEVEVEVENEPIPSKYFTRYQKQQVRNCTYCDPLLHSSSCDRCKRAL